jgi:hypothetical protein
MAWFSLTPAEITSAYRGLRPRLQRVIANQGSYFKYVYEIFTAFIVIDMSPPTSPYILGRDERMSPPTSL